MKKSNLKQQVAEAIAACQDKKADEITILELEKGSGAFTDYFVVCNGTNPRQIQAIADEVALRLKKAGLHPTHTEGYKLAEWVLWITLISWCTCFPRSRAGFTTWSGCGSRPRSWSPRS